MAANGADCGPAVQEILERTGSIRLLEGLGEELPGERRHTERTGQIAMDVMADMGESELDIVRAGVCITLHDIGKIDPIVQKLVQRPGPLTAEEKITVRLRHTSLGAGLIRDLDVDEGDRDLTMDALNTALCHHLSPDTLLRLGDGTMRLCQLVDRFDGMTDPTRSYRGARIITPGEAIATIRSDFAKVGALDGFTQFTLDSLEERYSG